MINRIMVVDRQRPFRERIAEILADETIVVTPAADAKSALALHRESPFELIITEMELGTESGLELLDQLRSIHPVDATVVMTEEDSLEAAKAAMHAGASDCFVKPLADADSLREAVKRSLTRPGEESGDRSLITRIRRDAAELDELNRQLLTLVARDSLTSLFNYRFFRQALDTEIARSRRHSHPFSLVLIDVDHFRLYNDAHGQIAGDELLRSLAYMLQAHCRVSSTAARYGGEKFIVLIPETLADGGFRFAENFRSMVEAHPFTGRETLPLGKVTISASVVGFPQSGREPAELIRRLEEALQRSKRSGRNVVSQCEALKPGDLTS